MAGTTTAVPGQQYVDFGLRGGDMPTELLIWEFKGEQGNMLVDGGGYYDITVAQSYSGLIAAFNGFTQSPDACMILDIRLRADVSEVYTPSLNPLHTAAYKSIRKLVESEPMPEADGLNLE